MKLDVPTYIEPSFNWKQMKQRLQDPDVPNDGKLAILLGLHYKLWHAGVPELERMLTAGGYPKDAVSLTKEAVDGCKECGHWKRPLTKPRIKTTVARHFNDRAQTDFLHVGAVLPHPR